MVSVDCLQSVAIGQNLVGVSWEEGGYPNLRILTNKISLLHLAGVVEDVRGDSRERTNQRREDENSW